MGCGILIQIKAESGPLGRRYGKFGSQDSEDVTTGTVGTAAGGSMISTGAPLGAYDRREVASQSPSAKAPRTTNS